MPLLLDTDEPPIARLEDRKPAAKGCEASRDDSELELEEPPPTMSELVANGLPLASLAARVNVAPLPINRDPLSKM